MITSFLFGRSLLAIFLLNHATSLQIYENFDRLRISPPIVYLTSINFYYLYEICSCSHLKTTAIVLSYLVFYVSRYRNTDVKIVACVG